MLHNLRTDGTPSIARAVSYANNMFMKEH